MSAAPGRPSGTSCSALDLAILGGHGSPVTSIALQSRILNQVPRTSPPQQDAGRWPAGVCLTSAATCHNTSVVWETSLCLASALARCLDKPVPSWLLCHVGVTEPVIPEKSVPARPEQALQLLGLSLTRDPRVRGCILMTSVTAFWGTHHKCLKVQ